MSHRVDPSGIVFGDELRPYRRRARLTGEQSSVAKRLLGRRSQGQRSLGLDPVTPGQIRFQAFLAWALWGEATSHRDPGGSSRRALSYSFQPSQGPDYWELQGVERYSDNLPRQFVGRGRTPPALPGLELADVTGRLISLRHRPTSGVLRARVTSDEVLDGDLAGAWAPEVETRLSFEAAPRLSDDASALLAATLTRLVAIERVSNRCRHREGGSPLTSRIAVSDHIFMRCAAPNIVTVDATHGDHGFDYLLLEAMFAQPGLLPPDSTLERVEDCTGLLRRGQAEMWLLGAPTQRTQSSQRSMFTGGS